MGFHFTPLRRVRINRSWRECWEKGILIHCLWHCKLVQPRENSVDNPQKVKNNLQYNSAIPPLTILSKNWTFNCPDICSSMFNAALFTVARKWRKTKCPATEKWIMKMWCKCTMEYYWAINKNDVMKFAVKWMELENNILREIIQFNKNWQTL